MDACRIIKSFHASFGRSFKGFLAGSTFKVNNGKLILYSVLGLLLLAAFLVRIWPLERSHWWDETVYLQHSEVFFSGRTNFNEFWLRPPMLPILIAVGYLFKHHMFTSSVIVSLLGTAGVLFTFLVGKEMFDKKTGFIGALFMAFSPFIVTSSHWIMTNIPSLTFISISLYLALKGMKKNSKLLYLLSGIFFGIAILTRFTSLIVMFIIPLYLFLYKKPLKDMLLYGFGLSIPMVPYLIWSQLTQGFFLAVFINANRVISDVVGGPFFYIQKFIVVFPVVVVAGLAVYVIAQIACIKNTVKAFKDIALRTGTRLPGKFTNEDFILVAWFVIFLIYLSITPHKEPRYILPIALPVVLLCARGYGFLFNFRNKYLKIMALVLLLVLCFTSFSAAFSKLDEPFINEWLSSPVQASEFTKTFDSSLDLVYTNQNYPVYAYYTGMKIEILWDYDSRFYERFPENMPSKGYFIFDKNAKKEPDFQWLENRTEFTRLNEINELIIYEYSPAAS